MGRPTTHGMINTPTYRSWEAMKQRCLNKNLKTYKHYGGRGIVISDRWINSFENFLEDMGGRPEGTTLDRIDNNGNYHPANCRWATHIEQGRNRRTSRLIEIDGETKNMSEWCSIYNVKRNTVDTRLKRGWDIKRAFTEGSEEPRRGWTPVSESTPELCNDEGYRRESANVLLLSTWGEMFTGIFCQKYDDFDPEDVYPIYVEQYGRDAYQMDEGVVTHWRHLPDKPGYLNKGEQPFFPSGENG